MRKRGIPATAENMVSQIAAAVARSSGPYRTMLIRRGALRNDGKVDAAAYLQLGMDKLSDILAAVRNEVGYDI